MNDSLQVWANIAQVLSLLISILALFVTVVIWRYPTPPAMAPIVRRARPLLLFTSIAAFSFWLGTQAFPPNSQTQADAQATNIALQSTITALQKQTTGNNRTAIAAAPPVTAVTVVTAITAPPAITAVTQIVVTQVVANSPPVVVTATPEPPTPTPDNPPLAVGDTFKSNGAELTLTKAELTTNQLSLYWKFVNNTTQKLSLKISNENFTAVDNRGTSLQVGQFRSGVYYCPNFEKLLEPGEVIMNSNCDLPLQIHFDTSNCNITDVIVTANKISPRIELAKWKIAVKTC